MLFTKSLKVSLTSQTEDPKLNSYQQCIDATPSRTALPKELNQFIRKHNFFSQSSTARFTTSDRRTFERDVYDFARALNLSRRYAREAISKARDFCEQSCDSDNSAWENEIDDSTDTLKRLSSVAVSAVRLPTIEATGDTSIQGESLNDTSDGKNHDVKEHKQRVHKKKPKSPESSLVIQSTSKLEESESVNEATLGRAKTKKRKHSQVSRFETSEAVTNTSNSIPNVTSSMQIDTEQDGSEQRSERARQKQEQRLLKKQRHLERRKQSDLIKSANEAVPNENENVIDTSRLTGHNRRSSKQNAIYDTTRIEEIASDVVFTNVDDKPQESNTTISSIKFDESVAPIPHSALTSCNDRPTSHNLTESFKNIPYPQNESKACHNENLRENNLVNPFCEINVAKRPDKECSLKELILNYSLSKKPIGDKENSGGNSIFESNEPTSGFPSPMI